VDYTNKAPKRPEYLIQEPVTGLYANTDGDTPRLTSRKDASRFRTFAAAAEAASRARLTEQPHELVRVDA
jgi:hypothetical protein